MAFTVEFSARAYRDIDEIVEYIQADSPVNATRWRQRLHERLQVLSAMPHAFALAPENEHARCEVRQLICGRHRVLYTVREGAVCILTVRHGARRFVSADEIDRL